jgi:hypothetical protein
MQDGSTLKTSVILIRDHLCAKCYAKNRLALKAASVIGSYRQLYSRTLFLFCDPGHNEQ